MKIISPCPNPKCRKDVKTAPFLDDGSDHGKAYGSVICTCGYRGPYASNEDEAIKLHNDLCNTFLEKNGSVLANIPQGYHIVIDAKKLGAEDGRDIYLLRLVKSIKSFSELRKKMSPASQARAEALTNAILNIIDPRNCIHEWQPQTCGVWCSKCGSVVSSWPTIKDYEDWLSREN